MKSMKRCILKGMLKGMEGLEDLKNLNLQFDGPKGIKSTKSRVIELKPKSDSRFDVRVEAKPSMKLRRARAIRIDV